MDNSNFTISLINEYILYCNHKYPDKHLLEDENLMNEFIKHFYDYKNGSDSFKMILDPDYFEEIEGFEIFGIICNGVLIKMSHSLFALLIEISNLKLEEMDKNYHLVSIN